MNIPQKIKSWLIALMAIFLLYPASSRAQCVDGTIAAERDLWAVHNCWWDFVLWQYQNYNMNNVYWGGWGFNDACNLALPYAKCVNASYLLTYGLSEGAWQWHGTLDYRRAGEGRHNDNHYFITYRPSTNRTWLAQASPGFTDMGCLLFDTDQGTGNPATRAGDYVHEGWHHWEMRRGYAGHRMGPIGACTLTAAGCDWYYWHGVGTYAFGEMHKYTADGRFFHSPTQAQCEFLCDVAEQSQGWVPANVRTLARNEANVRLATRFQNAVAYRCGDPRPW